jgi:replicative DNA helicase
MSDNPARSPDTLAPHSAEAEEAVLGAVLVNPETLLEVAAFLQPEDFFLLRHSLIWRAMLRLHERDDYIDNLTVSEELRSTGDLEEVGGVSYILYLINNSPSSLHAEVYGRIVERTAVRRRLLQAANEIAQQANAQDADVNQVIERSEKALFDVTERRLRKDVTRMDDAVAEYYNRIEYLVEHQDESLGIPTDYHDIDRLLGGLQKSDLIILAARPGMGKTSLGLNIAKNVARHDLYVAVFSLEMGTEQLVQRLISSDSGIDSQKLRLGTLDVNEFRLFQEAADRLSRLPIFLDDTVGISPTQLRTKARRLHREHKLDLVIVDYLQLMNGRQGDRGNQNREQEISYISQALKELARELEIPVLALAQLNRGVEQRADKRPMMSDLRESGAIEQNSDVIMFIYRDDVYNEDSEKPNIAEVIIAKHRNGPTGTVELLFEKHLTQFRNLTKTNIDFSTF